MNILAIDTTNTNAHIVAQINNVNHYKSMSSQEKHSEHLLLNIENVLSENNIELNDIDILGVVFTHYHPFSYALILYRNTKSKMLI